jgi:hypothetical protein
LRSGEEAREMEKRIESATRKGIAYLITSNERDTFWKDSYSKVAKWGYEYQTYGDGMTQHSMELAVHRNELLDFLVSLAIAASKDSEIVDHLSDYINWPDDICKDRIEFFSGLKYDENKVRYYNGVDLKVSTSESKRHDKRWEEVPSWADGSVESVCQFVNRSYWACLDRFSAYLQVRDAMNYGSVEGWNIGYPSEKDQDFSNVHSAYYILDNLVRAKRMQESAKRGLECLRYNMRLDKVEVDFPEEKAA